jgi:serine/threonine-protein kinase CTR1
LSEVAIFFSLYACSDDVGQGIMKPDIMVPEAPRVVLPLVTSSNIKLELDKKKELVTTQLRNTVSDLSLAADDLIIPWNELILKEKIGAGTRKFSLF